MCYSIVREAFVVTETFFFLFVKKAKLNDSSLLPKSLNEKKKIYKIDLTSIVCKKMKKKKSNQCQNNLYFLIPRMK